MTRTNINPDQLAPPVGPYVHAVKVEPGTMVFVSGCISTDAEGNVVGAGDIEAQTRQVMDNLKACLESAGAELRDVVKITGFVRDFEDYPKIAPIRSEYLTEPYPASTMFEVSRLIFPELLIEIEAVAVVGAGGGGADGS